MNISKAEALAIRRIPNRRVSKWLVLALVTLAHAFVVGFPWTVMPVLFSAASSELNLSIGQIGMLWGMLPVGAAVFAVPGGMLGDRLGFVKAIGIGCFAVAAANALRGFSESVWLLTIAMFLCGATVALVFPNLQRIASVFFPKKQVGLATGISISGFAVGGFLTTAFAGTLFMPILGGWRNVVYLYSALCIAMGVVWFLLMRGASDGGIMNPENGFVTRPSFRESMVAVFKVRATWLLALGNLGVVGSFIALNGYLPVYLERTGLPKSIGDTMSSTLFIASIVGAIGVPALAERIGAARAVIIASSLLTSVSIALLSIAGPSAFWVLIPMVGCLTQGIGTLVIAHTLEIKAIGAAYAGTALGLIGGLANFGGFVMPLIGGKLAETNPVWPFIMWSVACLAGTSCFFLLKETRRATKGLTSQV